MSKSRTLVDKIWDSHVIADLGDNTYLMHIDRNFQHELTGSTSLNGIDKAVRQIRNKELDLLIPILIPTILK